MKTIIRTFILLLFIVQGYQSSGQEDSLAAKSYDELRTLISQQLIERDTVGALLLVTYHKNRAETENNAKETAFGYGRYGYIVGVMGNLEEGIAGLDKTIELAEANDLNELELRAHISKGYIYNDNGYFPESIDSYYTAMKIAEDSGKYETYYGLVVRIGWIKTSMEDHEGAITILKNGLNSVSSVDIPMDENFTTRSHLKTSFLINIANAQNKGGRADSSLYYASRARSLLTIPEDSCYVKTISEIEANAYLLKNRFDAAETALKVFMQSCRPNNKLDSLRYSGNMAKLYLGRKQYRKAIEVSLSGLTTYKVPAEEEKYMFNYYLTLAKAFKNIGKLDSANFYLEKHLYTTVRYNELSDELTASFKDQEVKTFKAELDTLALEKNQREKFIIYGVVAGGLVILLLVMGLFRSNKLRIANEVKFEALLAKAGTERTSNVIIDTKDDLLEEQGTTDVNPETRAHILDGLKKLEDQNYFLHPACNAHNVAKRIKTNTTYLSKVINSEFGKNFSTYINDLRINYAIIRLKEDRQFRGYTIQSIATELGYKSADSFTKYFKKDTGLLPSFYIKKLSQAN